MNANLNSITKGGFPYMITSIKSVTYSHSFFVLIVDALQGKVESKCNTIFLWHRKKLRFSFPSFNYGKFLMSLIYLDAIDLANVQDKSTKSIICWNMLKNDNLLVRFLPLSFLSSLLSSLLRFFGIITKYNLIQHWSYKLLQKISFLSTYFIGMLQ